MNAKKYRAVASGEGGRRTPNAERRAPNAERRWGSLEQLASDPEFQIWLHREFPAAASEFSDPLARREFLRLMVASFALMGLGACTRPPPQKIVPYLEQPELLSLAGLFSLQQQCPFMVRPQVSWSKAMKDDQQKSRVIPHIH
jgi:MoCo/4Fe-4S cofactor protein with predicted Tat translocation signal